MHNEFTAIIERDEDWYVTYCPEVPGANGQGKTVEECKANLSEAISRILEERRQDAMCGLPLRLSQGISTELNKVLSSVG